MRLNDRIHLTYCTNVHPAEDAAGVLALVGRDGPVAQVLGRVGGPGPFGVGLRLSDAAARGDAGALRAALDERGMYCFTVNGFVHGGFQVDGVKEAVYAPPWGGADHGEAARERVAYVLRCGRMLADLLPDGVAGSLSTSAGTYRPWGHSPGVLAACAASYVEAVIGLRALRDRTGRTVRLAVEPEPWTSLQTSDDAVRFWEEHLRPAARAGGVGEADLRELIGLCFDACHLAVMFEAPAQAVATLADGGVPIHKVQVTSALEVDADEEGARALAGFDEPRFLHQTVGRRDDGRLLMARDLPELPPPPALPDDPAGWGACDVWRSHFHVAVYAEAAGAVRTTRPFLEQALRALVDAKACDHYEVETYTWDVTPEGARDDLVTMLARELAWTRERLAPRAPMERSDRSEGWERG